MAAKAHKIITRPGARRAQILDKAIRYWMAEARRLKGYARKRAWANAIEIAATAPGWVQLRSNMRSNPVREHFKAGRRGLKPCGLARITYRGPRGGVRGRIQYLTRNEGREARL